ncbi:MAG TPA: NADH-quinone oxidoreductase subunit J [Methylophilaceae bacterium]|nr:NADH-quinone oxidoreductase subunit J [Methylophilaceae bacterium]
MTFFGLPFHDIVFYVLATILLYAAVSVITTRNPVYAALYLVLAFFTAAGIWLLLEAEFLAITLVLVYVGAVMVLFLFVVMMLDINLDRLREGFWKALPVALPVGGLMAVEMVMIVGTQNFGVDKVAAPVAKSSDYSNTAELGRVLYTDYLLPFELASIVLLVAIVAAIALTLRGRRESKSMDPAKQVLVKKSDRLRIVKMDATVEQAAENNDGSAKEDK